MLQATLAKDTETMTKIIQYAHNTEVPILSYNNETELSAIVNLVYLLQEISTELNVRRRLEKDL